MFFVWCLSVHERWKYNYRFVKFSIVMCIVIELSGYCKCLSTVGEKSRITSSISEYDNMDGLNNKQIVPINSVNSFLRSVSSYNSNRYNYTDYFISNKTKSYSKLIYQDINIESLDDNDQQNHLENDNNNDDFSEINNLMYFGTENYTVVTSQIGSTAMIPCSVHHIGEGMVSWIRRKDYHLLTVGLTTYSSDERFSTIHLQHSEDWTLQIKFVQLRDAGIYECQVSTHPPTSIFIQLNVVEARAEISGPSEKYLKPGSTLRLACKVMRSTEPPLYIFWYHNNRMINYDSGVNVSTESDNRYSELTIAQTSQSHSGNYSCVPNSAAAASTFVHIFNGENPAAIHHVGHSNPLSASASTSLVITSMTLVLIVT